MPGYRTPIVTSLLFAGAASLATAGDVAQPGPGEPDLAAVVAATERFKNVEVALAEGYLADPLCETAAMMGRDPALGAMGVHVFHPELLGIAEGPGGRVTGTSVHTDFLRPSILIYEPQADGRLELVAVENLVFADAWAAAGHDRPPTFHGVPYDTMIDDPATAADEAHNFVPHHDRHVWLYRANPGGIFAPFNPMVTCEHHRTPDQHAGRH